MSLQYMKIGHNTLCPLRFKSFIRPVSQALILILVIARNKVTWQSHLANLFRPSPPSVFLMGEGEDEGESPNEILFSCSI